MTLRAFAAAFAFGAAMFLFLPDATVELLNTGGARFGDFVPLPASALRFWPSLAVGYMVLITAFAYVAQRDLHRHRDLIALLAIGKAATSLTALGFYICSVQAFAYLVTFLLDGSIMLVALAIWFVVPTLSSAAAGSRTITAGARLILDAVLEAMIPQGGPFAEGARDVPLARDVEGFVAGFGPVAVRALQLGLRLFDVSPFCLPPLRMRRFSRLSLEERVALLEAGEQSRLVPRRLAVHGLKMLAMMHFYARPEIQARLGYPHPLDRVPRSEAA